MSGWQDVVSLLLVLLASLSLARRGWRLFFQRPRGCGACGTCPGATPSQPAVTQITHLPSASRQIRA
jgi:hypothetical protein